MLNSQTPINCLYVTTKDAGHIITNLNVIGGHNICDQRAQPHSFPFVSIEHLDVDITPIRPGLSCESWSVTDLPAILEVRT